MDDEATLALYDRRRGCSRALANEMLRASGRDSNLAAGQRLGLVHEGVLALDNMQEASIVGEACLYAVRDANGACLAQRFAASGRYAERSDMREALEAMCRARFSIFALSDVLPGVSVTATDLITEQTVRIVDRGLSTSPAPMYATRLVEYPEFSVTTGAAIPITTEEQFERVAEALNEKGISRSDLIAHETSTKLQDDFYYTVVAHLLREGALRSARYLDPTNPDEVAALEEGDPLDQFTISVPNLPTRRVGPKVGRNDPCPCGSGKKYKKCHGA